MKPKAHHEPKWIYVEGTSRFSASFWGHHFHYIRHFAGEVSYEASAFGLHLWGQSGSYHVVRVLTIHDLATHVSSPSVPMIVVLEGFLEKNMAKLPDEVPRSAASSAFLPNKYKSCFLLVSCTTYQTYHVLSHNLSSESVLLIGAFCQLK